MAMETGINTNMFRELNKIYIYSNEKDKTNSNNEKEVPLGTERCIFSGYLTQSIGEFTTQINSSSLNDSVYEVFNKVKPIGAIMKAVNSNVGKLIQNTAGVTTALNYDKLYQFTGTSTFAKELKCVLVTKDDFFEDVINPLWSLLEFIVPDEGKRFSETQAFQEMQKDINEGVVKNEDWSFVNDILKFAWDAAKNMLGDPCVFINPLQFHPDANIRIRLGNYITIENVIIDKISFTIPQLMYEDGLFDKVDVSLSIKGKRNISLKTFDWVKQIKETQVKFNSLSNNQILTLNDQFTN